jgi:Tol biopolymer transport system component
MIYSSKAGVIRRDLGTNAERVLWVSETGQGPLPEAVVSRDGKLMAVRQLHRLVVVDLTTGAKRQLFSKVQGELADNLWAIDWSGDGRHLVAVSQAGGARQTNSDILSFPLAGGEKVRTAAPARFQGLKLSPDGKLAAALASTRRSQVLALDNFLPIRKD